MKQGKHARKKIKIIEVYLVLLFIATLLMGIGYAQITDIEATIEGTVDATIQEGVFIADVVNIPNDSEDTEKSKINYFIGTMLDSEIVLGSASTSTVTYQITLYNNSTKDYLFIGVITDEYDDTLYSNENIGFDIEGAEEYVTTISPNGSLKFTITFKYLDGTNISNNTLTSKLNFRFKEIPTIALSNENETYTLTDIYPDYTPQTYKFVVSNYNKTETNIVPMKYYLETTIDSPLTAKIYDENGKEVTEGINIEGDGENQIDHTYTLEIIWDDSKETEYNSVEYADKEFECNIVLKAIPIDAKYMQYEITKQFNVDIKTASFSFNANPLETDILIKNNLADLILEINNYTSDTVYNKIDTTYEISLQENDNFTFTVNGESPVNNVVTKILSGGTIQENSLDIQFKADMSSLNVTENLTLKIAVKSAYSNIEVIEIPITITLHTVKVTLNPNGGSVSQTSMIVYQYKTYENLPTPTWTGHDFNGWYTAETGGKKVSSGDTVTVDSSTQVLYAQWTTHLLADLVSVGDYVNYPVSYSNVATTSSGSYTPDSDYNGWRVLSIEGTGDDKYVRLISGGVPLTYRHAALDTTSGASGVTNLTTNFFKTSITTSTNNTFHACGFYNASTIGQIQALFENAYTQTSSDGTPIVKSITKEDVEDALNITVGNLTDLSGNDLFGLLAEGSTSYYATYYLATKYEGYYLWACYLEGKVVYTYGVQGVRPVVSLKATVETTGKSGNVWQLSE